MTSEKLLADLKNGIVAPCYLLYGEQEYLINDTLRQILDLIIPKPDRDFGLFYIDAEDTDIDSLIEYVLTPSLLGSRKVVVVHNTSIFVSGDNLSNLIQKIRDNLDENPLKAFKYFVTFMKISGFTWEDLQGTGWEKISNDQWRKAVAGDSGEDREKWLPRILDIYQSYGLAGFSALDKIERLEEILSKGLPGGNCLIFTAETVDKRKKIYKIIAELGVIIYFGTARGEAAQKEILQQEAQQLLDRYGKKLSPAAWVSLGKKTGFELRRSIMEIEKLIFFVGDSPVIEEDDIAEVVGKTKEDSIFDLTAALSGKNQLAALQALKTLIDQGLHHLMILTMISREIRLLLHAAILVGSGTLPKFKNNMEYGWFQKNIYPALTRSSKIEKKRDDSLENKHPFVIFNALRNCGQFSYPVLVGFLNDLVEMERSMKSSAKDPQLLLENFLIRACAKVS
jgi:DNA polymerase III subunit delta